MTMVLQKKKKKAKNSLNSESTIQVHKQLRTKTQTSTTNQGTGHLVMMPITQDTMQKEGRGKGGTEPKKLAIFLSPLQISKYGSSMNYRREMRNYGLDGRLKI